MASYRIVNGQKVLVDATQRPLPAPPGAVAAPPQPAVAAANGGMVENVLAGLMPAGSPNVGAVEESDHGG